MNTTIKIALLAAAIALTGYTISAQEALLSTAENYFEFLALDGYASRPYLNYRTLSDSVWTIDDETGNLWSGVTLSSTRALGEEARLRVYGPELFTSFNSASPYGQNDGALWQGKGLNASLTGGARLEAYGLELTLKPQLAFSQNLAFDIMSSAYESEYGYIWGLTTNGGADAPQRFGNNPLFTFSWGDSEIRYSWKTLTAGFGTQSIWLGPAKINPLLHSNNATPYPKLDVGLKRQRLTLPFLDWYAGDIEGRLWCGYLSESDYFDSDSSNDHNMISGLTFCYAPSFLDGLTFFANRVYLSKWEATNFRTLPSLFFINLEGGGAQDVWDQRASLGFDWLLPNAGVEVYGEAGINDYGPSLDGYIRYPFHSIAYTAGVRKSVPVPLFEHVRGELLFEWTNLEASQDYQFHYPASFYMHYQIKQGYTNGGQWLGAGNGTGGNSQYLGFKMYHPKGSVNLFVHRQNPDNDYIYAKSVGTENTIQPDCDRPIKDFKAILTFGAENTNWLGKHVILENGLFFVTEHNPDYDSPSWSLTSKRYNFRIVTSLKWTL